MIEALLRELLDEVRGLRADMRARAPSTLSRSDRAALSRILPAIGGVFGSELFTVRELFASHEPALRVVLDGRTSTAIGQLFGRANSQAVDGYQVEDDGSELNVNLWRVVKVHGVQPSATLTVPPRSLAATR